MYRSISAIAAIAVMLAGAQARAQEATGQLGLELNALQQGEAGCRITFLANNGLDGEITRSTFELALFGMGGGIDRLVSLQFETLPQGKSKVVQFELKDLACADLTRVLVNDITACEGGLLTPPDCLAALVTSTRTAATFGV